MIVAIDPSFTRTGVILYRNKENYSLFSITHNENVYSVITALEDATKIAMDIKKIVKENLQKDEDLEFVVEYPILATRSGSYLVIILAKLDSLFRALHPTRVIFLPAVVS